jgi:hypothetical protein
VENPDERSIITYVSSLFDAMPLIQPVPNKNHKEKVRQLVLKKRTMLSMVIKIT